MCPARRNGNVAPHSARVTEIAASDRSITASALKRLFSPKEGRRDRLPLCHACGPRDRDSRCRARYFVLYSARRRARRRCRPATARAERWRSLFGAGRACFGERCPRENDGAKPEAHDVERGPFFQDTRREIRCPFTRQLDSPTRQPANSPTSPTRHNSTNSYFHRLWNSVEPSGERRESAARMDRLADRRTLSRPRRRRRERRLVRSAPSIAGDRLSIATPCTLLPSSCARSSIRPTSAPCSSTRRGILVAGRRSALDTRLPSWLHVAHERHGVLDVGGPRPPALTHDSNGGLTFAR